MPSNPLHDRSRIVADWKCQRAAFHAYESDGTGFASGSAAYELYFGTLVHDATSTIARFQEAGDTVPIDDIANAAYHQLFEALSANSVDPNDEYPFEQATLIEGLIRGFYKHTWPRLMETYPEIVAIEQEILYTHDGCDFMSKPDLLLANSEGHLVYIEYKTTSYANEKWFDSWETSPQLHSTLHAIKAVTGLDVTAAIVQGLYKGNKYLGRQGSPFCYAYHRPGQPPLIDEQWSYTYKPGMKKYPIWLREGGLTAWLDKMPEETLKEQFPQVPPVYYRDYLAEAFFKQSALRRKEIELAKQIMAVEPASTSEVMAVSFKQNFEACKPFFGNACTFYSLCHQNKEGKHPLEMGYQRRVPHHEPEAARLAATTAQETTTT